MEERERKTNKQSHQREQCGVAAETAKARGSERCQMPEQERRGQQWGQEGQALRTSLCVPAPGRRPPLGAAAEAAKTSTCGEMPPTQSLCRITEHFLYASAGDTARIKQTRSLTGAYILSEGDRKWAHKHIHTYVFYVLYYCTLREWNPCSQFNFKIHSLVDKVGQWNCLSIILGLLQVKDI